MQHYDDIRYAVVLGLGALFFAGAAVMALFMFRYPGM